MGKVAATIEPEFAPRPLRIGITQVVYDLLCNSGRAMSAEELLPEVQNVLASMDTAAGRIPLTEKRLVEIIRGDAQSSGRFSFRDGAWDIAPASEFRYRYSKSKPKRRPAQATADLFAQQRKKPETTVIIRAESAAWGLAGIAIGIFATVLVSQILKII